MGYKFRRGTAAALSTAMILSLLSGCGNKDKDAFDTEATAATLDDSTMSAGVANFIIRYDQAQFESGFGMLLQYYGYTDIWNTDLYGTGEAYSETFKSDEEDKLEELMLCSEHAADYDIELTDDEKSQITETASDFIASNSEEVLNKMSATQETVEQALTYYAIQAKVEAELTRDVDTNVTDEEAAQRTVDYVSFYASTESETEAVSEGVSEGASEDNSVTITSEVTTEAENSTEAASGTETADGDTKTGAADEAETVVDGTEGETSVESAGESVAENSVSVEEGTEEITEAETETETELTAEQIEARAKAQAKAEEFLKKVQDADVQDADTFTSMGEEEGESDTTVTNSSWTFGADDTYPDAAVIDATTDLEDNTLVDHVVQVDDNFYVLYVADAFDEEATEEKKTEIVDQRKQDAIDAQYDT